MTIDPALKNLLGEVMAASTVSRLCLLIGVAPTDQFQPP
jgi:hypothetical protein